MCPPDDGTDGDDHQPFVYCPECEAKASPGWSFCRRCSASLEDATSPAGKVIVRTDGQDVDLTDTVGEVVGCEKCGHEEATVESMAVTGSDVSRALDIDSRLFKAVSCDRCGYTEWYRDRKPRVARQLFLR